MASYALQTPPRVGAHEAAWAKMFVMTFSCNMHGIQKNSQTFKFTSRPLSLNYLSSHLVHGKHTWDDVPSLPLTQEHYLPEPVGSLLLPAAAAVPGPSTSSLPNGV